MNVINGMPAHALLLHFVLVLVPLTAVLEIVCGLWPAARRGHLMWLTLILAVVTLALTPLTIDAGAWLYDRQANPSPILREHAARGGLMTYFSAALLVVAVLLVALRIVERRSDRRRLLLHVIVAIVVLVTGVASTLQIYRVGDAGAQAVWGG
ncbi:DUF2231 domain-containing protein [Mycobacterium timonense]|uniref:DUF2231 domain-containing protein n=1 Tax=Mycobacterium timonense TaxID=701043 RepID=A0A7I9Z5V3_9MYCO|nr:DUF2231 domain-containing protein [Mycobacterium timonense]GFG96087.1 hypothetical protein MTIM_19660 [Mycobacterium timonense]